MKRSRVALLTVAAGAVVCGCGPSAAARTPPGALSPAATIAGRTLSGASASLAALRGHPVVVVFWASWCGPCHDEQPRLNAAYTRWSARGVRFLGVDMLDDESAARAFQEQMHVAYPSVVDTDANDAAGFLVPAAPAIVLVDTQGLVADRVLGGLEVLSDADLDTAIEQLR